jgi:hypothetical protein
MTKKIFRKVMEERLRLCRTTRFNPPIPEKEEDSAGSYSTLQHTNCTKRAVVFALRQLRKKSCFVGTNLFFGLAELDQLFHGISQLQRH